MATLNYNGNEYNILYIDATIGVNEGDGSTPSTALSNIPTTLTDKTCYIIRRNADDETIYVDMPQSWYASLYYIMFLGMPLSDDPMYNLMESEAKTAWGADTGKYARIRCNTTSGQDTYYDYPMSNTNNHTLFKTNSVRNFYSGNCYFYRDGNGHNSDSNGRYMSWIFGFDYSSRFADITFNNCKFGYTQYNLENDDYLLNNDVSTDSSTYPQNKCRCFIAASNLNSFTINNCIINQVYVMPYCRYDYWYQPHAKCIYITGFNKSVFTNNQFNVLYRDSNTDYFYEDYSDRVWNNNICLYGGNRSSITVKNVEVNKIFTATNSRGANTNLYIYSERNTVVDNVKLNVKKMGNSSTFTTASYNTSLATFEFRGTNSLIVSNIYTNLSQSYVRSNYFVFIESMQDNAGNVSSKVENVYAKFSTTGNALGGNIVSISNTYYTWNSSTDPTDISNNSTWYERGYGRNESKAWIANNIIVDAPRYNGTVLSLTRAGAKSPYINGKVYLAHGTLDIKNHYWYYPTTVGVILRGNSYYKCDDYEANVEHPDYSGTAQIDWQPQSMSSVYINKSNCILMDENPYTTIYLASSNNSFVCPNYIKTGQFFQRNEVCFAKSWNTVRTGSNSQGSIRFNNNYAGIDSNSHPLVVGCEPYSGIQIVPSSTGKKVLTAYMATKNMDASEIGYTGRIGIHVNCPEKYTDYYNTEKTNIKQHEYTSEAIGWQSDNSTWSGDTNLRTYKCEIPIEVFTLDEPIDVKIWFNWYSVNGYVYVDPDFKLTDIV